MLRAVSIIIIALIFLLPLVAGGQPQYSIGIGGGLASLNGGSPPWHTLDPNYTFKFDVHLKDAWRLGIDFSYFKIYADSTASSEFTFGSDKIDRTSAWKGYDLAFMFYRRLFPSGGKFGINGGLGLGLSFWEMVDPVNGDLLTTLGERGEQVNYSTNEVFIASKLGLEYNFMKSLKGGLDINVNYLTGGGREFSQNVKDSTGHWNLKAGIFIAYCFGEPPRAPGQSSNVQSLSPKWDYEQERPPVQTEPKPRVAVDKKKDSDGDGILDGEDYCPDTPERAFGMVDIHGCPVDTDCDGFPDYLDECRSNPIGARVDDAGCPIDSDGDGVPDGLDNCPNSEKGLPVDNSGCLNLSLFDKPMILNIKYESGSFEIDRNTRSRLSEVARMLLRAPDIKVEINGYTDNVGTEEANRNLSQKRANRVRDFLVEQGIDTKRLIPSGKGEINFIASNKTSEGRQKNRRVELVFFQ